MTMGDDGDDVMEDNVEVVDDACFGMKEEDVYDEPLLGLGDGSLRYVMHVYILMYFTTALLNSLQKSAPKI